MNDKIYICGICGKKYHTIAERNRCERDCIVASEKAAAEKKKKELEAAKESRRKAIQKLIDDAAALSESYFNDYGEMPTIKYSIKGSYKKEDKNDSLLTSKEYADILKLFRLW